jgi:hypothetical protein
VAGELAGALSADSAKTKADLAGANKMEPCVDDEDTDGRRFYKAHSFTNTEPGATEPMYYRYR